MLKPLAIVLLLASTSLASDSRDDERRLAREMDRVARDMDRDKKIHKALAAQPTLTEWHPGATWQFVTTRPSGARDILVFRVTRERTATCTGVSFWKDIWCKLVVVKGHLPNGAAYQVEGRALFLDLGADICEADDFIEGAFSGADFIGTRGKAAVHGSLVQP
ncbi:MAG: hypothetical protein QOH01_2036 [Verrucomicrobiota bacterium]|jgi:hypothetical protein